MKKILLGLCLLSSLTFGMMEKQFDIKVEEIEIGTYYERPETKATTVVVKGEKRITQELFYKFVDMITEPIKVNVIRTEDKFIVCKRINKGNENYLPYMIFMFNTKTNSVVMMELSKQFPNDAKKLLGYLKANNLLSYENKLDIEMFFIDLF